MSPFQHLLVPVDFSEQSQRALDVACDLAVSFGAELTVLHTYEDPASAYWLPPSAYKGVPPLAEAARARLDQTLVEVKRRVPGADAILREGSPWREILAAIDETRADLIVMSTHGHGGFDRALLGSIAERVVRMSKVPVLTVKKPVDET